MITQPFVAPEEVIAIAEAGKLPKQLLASLLTPRARRPFYDACSAIEMRYTEACRAKNDPCLESGCSAEGDRCLQPILEAGADYLKACGATWAPLFADVANRDPSWRVALSQYGID